MTDKHLPHENIGTGVDADAPGVEDMLRMFTAIPSNSPPEEVLQRALAALAEVLGCDVACMVEFGPDGLDSVRAEVTPDAAVASELVWPIGPVARRVAATATAATSDAVDRDDLPARLRDRAGCAGAWIPLSPDAEPFGDLLILLRDRARPFTPSDVRLLTAISLRLRTGLETLERNVALERLAQAAPGLARHVDLGHMLEDAVVLFRDLTRTDSAFVVTIADGVFTLAAYTGIDTSIPRRWPRTVDTMPNWDLFSVGKPYVGGREMISDRPQETYPSPTVLCVPVVRDGETVALLGATGHRSGSFGKTGVDIAIIMANHLSVAMANAELYQALTDREHELRHQASHDPLTGLANRVQAGQSINRALATTSTGAVGLMFCDIDDFKAVNDRLGHEVGDELIRQVSLRLAGSVGPDDLVARFGGDEFVFVLDGVRDLADLNEAARRVQLNLADPVLLRGERIPVTASIGSVLGRPGTTASVMLRNADAAMYAAKGKGPGRIEVFDDAASTRSLDRLDLRSELGSALDRGELSVLYQPLVELKTNTIRSFEALVRWTHPVRGDVPPDVFIPMAEDTGAILQIGAWVLTESCNRLREWQREFPAAHLTIGVNISAIQLEYSSPSLVDIVRATGADPRDVWLEVTERMDTGGDISGQVDELRRAGAHFALDDFGMSYSSLTYLQPFPVEGIKIDKTFVSPMTDDETQRGIVRAIIALGDSLSVNVVAEGIETPEQVDALIELGCPLGQGYLLSSPLRAEECVTALRAGA